MSRLVAIIGWTSQSYWSITEVNNASQHPVSLCLNWKWQWDFKIIWDFIKNLEFIKNFNIMYTFTFMPIPLILFPCISKEKWKQPNRMDEWLAGLLHGWLSTALNPIAEYHTTISSRPLLFRKYAELFNHFLSAFSTGCTESGENHRKGVCVCLYIDGVGTWRLSVYECVYSKVLVMTYIRLGKHKKSVIYLFLMLDLPSVCFTGMKYLLHRNYVSLGCSF